MPANTTPGVAPGNLRTAAETRLALELEHQGMRSADALRVARELVDAGLVKHGKEQPGDEIGWLSQVDELGFGVLEASGFGNAANVASKVTGTPTAGHQAGQLVRKPEAAGEHAAEKAGSALTGVGQAIVQAIEAVVGGYGLRLLEIIAGGALVLFGLVTLARGGQTPNLPAVVPV